MMRYCLENSRLRIQVESRGAELHSLWDKDLKREYLWQGDPAIWTGRSPLLFPIVGKLKDDRYLLHGNTYLMPKHGFARNSEFALTAQSADSLTLSLTDSTETRLCYPYAFALHICFLLEENRLQITHTVVNPSLTETLLFSIGAHPGFSCQLGDCLVFEEMEKPEAYRLNEQFLLSDAPSPVPFEGKSLPLTAGLFENDALILQDPRSRWVTLRSAAQEDWLRVDFFDAPVLGLWAKPAAPFLCVEPWYGIDDHSSVTGELSQKPQILSLPPKSSYPFPLRITALA